MFKFFKNAFQNGKKKNSSQQPKIDSNRQESHIEREVNALYAVLVEAIGSDKLVIQAGNRN